MVDVSFRLDGRVALITGSTRGIGYAIARAMAQAGAHLVVSSESDDDTKQAAAALAADGLATTGIACDVGNSAAQAASAKGSDQRPGFDRLWKDAARRKFDVVMAWAIDRLGRSLADVAAFMADMKATGVDLYLDKQAVDTTTPSGRALLQMAGVFAECERELIRERTIAGQARARAAGVRFGRPTIAADREAAVRASLAAGMGIVKAAKTHGVGVGTVQRLKHN